jgi:hypothetical protein
MMPTADLAFILHPLQEQPGQAIGGLVSTTAPKRNEWNSSGRMTWRATAGGVAISRALLYLPKIKHKIFGKDGRGFNTGQLSPSSRYELKINSPKLRSEKESHHGTRLEIWR